MIQCQICQVTNDEAAQFCRECGGRLQSAPPPAQPSSLAEPDSAQGAGAAPAEPAPKRPRLHSPILGGGGADFEDDEPQSPSFKRVKSGQGGNVPSQSQAGTGGQRRGGLRSPLLGGDVDDMDEEDVVPRGKGFGGGKNKKTEFPHRHHDDDGHDAGQMAAQSGTGGQKSTGARGLRSPLLGGGADDDYDEPAPRGGGQRPTKPGRLRSPILGGGGDDYYDEEVFDEVVEEINDPTVLRSPLLAVRTPKAHAQPQAQAQPQHPQAADRAPMPGQPPLQVQPPMPPQSQPQVQPQMQSQAQPPVMPEPAKAPFVQGPYTQASGGAPNFALSGGPNYQPFPPNPGNSGNAGNIVAPQAPTQQPAYSPPPAPPAPAGFSQEAGQMQPSSQMQQATSDSYSYGYQAPLPPAPSSPATRPNQQALPPNPAAVMPPAPAASNFSAEPEAYTKPSQIPTPGSGSSSSSTASSTSTSAAKPSARATGTKFDAGRGEDDAEEVPKLKGMRGSKLLGDVSDDPIGPLDRRSRFNDRRTTPRGNDRRGTKNTLAALHQDEEPVEDLPVSRGSFASSGSMSGGMSGGGAAPNAMAPLLMATAVIALIAKGYYIASFASKPGVFAANMPATIDQVTTMLVLVGIILFAIKAMQKH